jgi:hypothetical protein
VATTTLIYYLINNCIKKMYGLGKKRGLGLVQKKEVWAVLLSTPLH